jgi:hypothetical protein
MPFSSGFWIFACFNDIRIIHIINLSHVGFYAVLIFRITSPSFTFLINSLFIHFRFSLASSSLQRKTLSECGNGYLLVIDQPVFKNTTYIRKSKFHVNKEQKNINIKRWVRKLLHSGKSDSEQDQPKGNEQQIRYNRNIFVTVLYNAAIP